MHFALLFLEFRCHSRIARLSDCRGKTLYITVMNKRLRPPEILESLKEQNCITRLLRFVRCFSLHLINHIHIKHSTIHFKHSSTKKSSNFLCLV